MDFRRAKYILPNFFTLSSICAGLYSIHLSTTAQSVSGFSLAAWLLVVSMVCDAFDGRVARMTRTESELGIQLDSLADAISFGVAPGFLLYHWGLTEWGMAGFFLSFAYVGCVVLRLARFNVLSARGEGVENKKYFTGLPTPLAAGSVVAIVMAHVSYIGTATTDLTWGVAGVAVLLAALMISNVRYRTFKEVSLDGGALFGAALLVVGAVLASMILNPSVTFVMLMAAYILLGLGGEVVDLARSFVGPDEAEEPRFAEAGDGE